MQLKRLLCMSCIALLPLTGCAKEITKADAQQYAADNFGGERVKVKGHVKSTVGEISGFYESSKSHYENKDEDIEEILGPVKAEYMVLLNEAYKYYLDGKKLQYKIDLNGKEGFKEYTHINPPENCKLEFKLYLFTELTERGYVHISVRKIHFNFEMSENGITTKGALNFESITTYNY